MRRILQTGVVALVLTLAAGLAAAETIRDTRMLRAKDSKQRLVSIGGETFYLGSQTQFVYAGKSRLFKPGQKLTMADLDVPEVTGAVAPKTEPGIRVKYEADLIGDRRELRKVLVYGKGRRSH